MIIPATEVDEYLSTCESVNKRASTEVYLSTGVKPRTKIAGYSDNFSVDISTGKIYVAKVDPSLLLGYLAHENGHRSAFPVTTAAAMAFTVAIKALSPEADDASLLSVANIVSDAFSDTMLLALGSGDVLAKRVQHFLKSMQDHGPAMIFKAVVYRSIEVASAKNQKNITVRHTKQAAEDIEKLFPHASDVVREVYPLVERFVAFVGQLFDKENPRNIPKYFLNPIVEYPLSFKPLAEIAAELLKMEGKRRNAKQTAGGCEKCSRSNSSSGSPYPSAPSRGGITDIEGGDLTFSRVDPMDVHAALVMAVDGYDLSAREASVIIEKIYSEKLKEEVAKLLEKIRVVYSQLDRSKTVTSGFSKETSELWLYPFGDPDEDSVLKEKHKLLWRVEYKVPRPRGRLHTSYSGVPEKVIVVMDESGSTLADRIGSTTVLSVEALVNALVVAGLRYVGGAKEVVVIKFSDKASVTYRGGNIVEACTKIIIPHSQAGKGTNILEAVQRGIKNATKNSALVVVTDLEIDNYTADVVGRMLNHAVSTGDVGFVVFIVVNPKKNISEIDIVKNYLRGTNAVVAQISSSDDLEVVGNNIITKILGMRRSN